MMPFLAWLGVYLGVLLLEVSFLPRFFGTALPMLTPAVLVLGAATLGFWRGFWFAGLVGLIHDLFLPGGVPATLLSLGVFFLIQGFRRFAEWHQPWNRIGAVASGILALPLLWLAGSWARGQELPFLIGRELGGMLLLREVSFTVAWFSVFVWVAILRAGRERRSALTRL